MLATAARLGRSALTVGRGLHKGKARSAMRSFLASSDPELRALGVTSIEVQYEGYGDSGNVEDVVVTPDAITLTEELRRRVEDFGWDFAYALSPGFENNEGGYGELTWVLEVDKIDVSHSNRYIETNTTEHEGL